MVSKARLSTSKISLSISPGLFLVGVLLLVYAISYLGLYPTTRLKSTLSELSKFPTSMRLRTELIQMYLLLNEYTQAEKELAIGTSFYGGNSATLGTDSEMATLEHVIQTRSVYQSNLIAHWSEATTRYPAYRDGWVQLVYLAKKSGDMASAKLYLEKVRDLDPNYVVDLSELD